jgi:uncharacterized protein YbaA (DUF1428 family)
MNLRKSLYPALFILALVTIVPLIAGAKEARIYELRTYHAAPGKLDALHARFRDHTLKLFEKHGITNVGYFVPAENTDNLLTYFVSYPSRKAREKSWKAFKNDPDWKAAYKASTADGKLVQKVDSTFLIPTEYSPALEISKSDGDRLFELRTYTTEPNRLEALDARFRDHTIELFGNHGMTNVIYLHRMDDQEGAGNTLVYLLAHKDEETRNASFKAFSQDPAWQSARDESQKDGKILVKKGVHSVFLIPTDYSPMK